jgi:hypothetical protein
MDEEHERILQQLREAAAQGLDSEAFYQALRQASRLGPVPRDVLQEILQRHYAGKVPEQGPVIPPEREERLREGLRRVHGPSERARDPHHPVGAAADALRQALPGFQPWQVDVSKIDLNEVTRKVHAGQRTEALSYLLPPGFEAEASGSYLTAERGLLIEEEDGSVLTMGELFANQATREAFRERMEKGSRWSDTLGLLWKRPEPLELRAVEELLRSLSEKMVPGTPVRFLPRQEPRFRAALRMQLGDSPIPAAIGGVLHHLPVLPEGIDAAAVTIYLEPWATVRSGEAIELAAGPAFPSFERPGGA